MGFERLVAIRLYAGYGAGCAIGALGVNMWAEMTHPSGNWLRSYLVILCFALLVCLPTVMLGRFVMSLKDLSGWQYFAALWVAAGVLPTLILLPDKFGLVTALVLVPFGILAGVASFRIAAPGSENIV